MVTGDYVLVRFSNWGETRWAVSSPEVGLREARKQAQEDLQDPRVEWNTFGLLCPDGEDWCDEDGQTLDELMLEE